MDQSTRIKEIPAEDVRVSAAQLAEFVTRAFIAAGLPEADAKSVAGLMVEADLRGSDTHGVIRLPLYVRRLRAGGINAKPNIRVVHDRAAVALIDGDNGMGHLVMRRAAELAIEKAKATGIGWVGARMSNHAGPAALYVTMPLAHDMIGLYFAVGSNNHLPPWGGSESLLGTNPMAVAVPTLEEPPIVLDMAPTVAAYGKVRLKAQRGEPMPIGWMIDREGKPLTDAKRAFVCDIRHSRRLPGVERIWLPGEQSHAKQRDRRARGVPMPKALRESLDAVARELKVAMLP
jgi:LDH2 family malate/lactate/ureidoglycolate dehydrogenase